VDNTWDPTALGIFLFILAISRLWEPSIAECHLCRYPQVLLYYATVVKKCGNNLEYIFCFSSRFLRSAKQHFLFSWRRSNKANIVQQLSQLVNISCFITLNSEKGDACIFSRTWQLTFLWSSSMRVSVVELAREIFARFLLFTSPIPHWLLLTWTVVGFLLFSNHVSDFERCFD